MRKVPSFISLVGLILLFASCGNSSRSNSEYVPVNDYSTIEVDEEDGRGGYDEYTDTDEEGPPDIGNIRLTGEIVQCNKCMGYGMVQDGMYGQPEICKFCWMSTYMRMQQGWTGFDGRYGQVDAVFNTLPADYFDGLDWNESGGYDDNGGGNVRTRIHITQGGTCNNCHGSGSVSCAQCMGQGGWGYGMFYSQCWLCHGSGSLQCGTCHGTGERE